MLAHTIEIAPDRLRSFACRKRFSCRHNLHQSPAHRIAQRGEKLGPVHRRRGGRGGSRGRCRRCCGRSRRKVRGCRWVRVAHGAKVRASEPCFQASIPEQDGGHRHPAGSDVGANSRESPPREGGCRSKMAEITTPRGPPSPPPRHPLRSKQSDITPSWGMMSEYFGGNRHLFGWCFPPQSSDIGWVHAVFGLPTEKSRF